jgi:hypothetical protein
MKLKHLELLKIDDIFFIQINSLVGRISLFADHPKFKLKQAVNLKNKLHETGSDISLIQLKRKDLYILEDKDSKGNLDQNFIFVSPELSKTMNVVPSGAWLRHHIFDFLTRSLSVLFFILYMIYYFSTMRYFNTMDTLFVLRYITGVLMLVFALAYYYLRSSKTKSSFLRFCFKFELFIFITVGTINNFHYLVNFNNAMDIF